MIRSLLLIFTLSIPLIASARDGIVRGSVFDRSTGEPLIGVTVQIEGTTIGAVTDLDGKFEIRTAPGIYTLVVSYLSFSTLRIEDTAVSEGNVTVLDNIALQENVEQLQEVVITAAAIRTSEEALLTVKRKSVNLLDGVSSANFKRIGDSDAAAAVKRVPGVSVEGGKYVFVRGLGDRYTKSTLNDVDIPGLDPDRNTVQLDLFPTSIVDNIVVLKSFTADLPGDFTGGIVNINTKDFPEEKTLNISASLGYNPTMHFNSDYLTYAGGKTDFLGFDDGTREIPTGRRDDIPLYTDVVANVDSEEGRQFRSILEGFNPTLAAMKKRSFMDYGLGLNFGDQFSKGKNVLGYTFSLSYGNTTEYFGDAIYGRYGKGNSNETELQVREYQTGALGSNNVSLSGTGGFALKRDHAKYKINLLHLQNGESRAGIFDYDNSDLGANFQAVQHNLEYSQRSLTNVLLSGDHYSSDSRWHINWKVSPTRSRIADPDIRYTRYRVDGDNLSIGTESGYPERIWRYLEEDNLAGKIDIDRGFTLLGSAAKLKFGSVHVYKHRDYEIQNFQIIPQGVAVTGDPDELFLPVNLWPANAGGSRGTRYAPLFIPDNPNEFAAHSTNTAFYVSGEFDLFRNLRGILGVRAENFQQRYSGKNQQGLVLERERVIDDLDFFPSVNLIYALTDAQNFRFSYSRTIARPSFKEASYAEILDPLTGRTFIGSFFPDVNPSGEVIWDGNLTATRIDNVDARWEIFQPSGQTISASVFYKQFDRPIEIVQYVQAPNNFQPRNVGDGKTYGLEFELRQNLAIVSTALENLSLNGNITITRSQVQMTPTEYNSRVLNARENEIIKPSRVMAGQAPYVVNAGLSYSGTGNGLEAGLFYNVQGETLTFVGIADKPDVYSVPFNSLNFNATKYFGKEEKLQLGINVVNVLGAEREFVFRSFRAADQVFSRLRPGTSVNFKFSYNF